MSKSRVIIYTYNTHKKRLSMIDELLALKLMPVILDDCSFDDVKEVLRIYLDKIDILTFDEHKGFDACILQGIRHVIRGTDAISVIICDARYDMPLYIRQLTSIPKDEYTITVVYNISQKYTFFALCALYILHVFEYVFHNAHVKSPTSHYCLLNLQALRKTFENPFFDHTFSLYHLYRSASSYREPSIQWIPIDEPSIKKNLFDVIILLR